MAMIFSEKNVEVHSLHILLTVFICPFSKGKHPGVKKIAFLITDGLLRGDLCKSGPGKFASEKTFPLNFAQ